MKKEDISIWVYRIRTLPNRQPQIAKALCRLICLWLVIIPAIIMARKGVEFSYPQLTIPLLGSIGLATLLFSMWKKLANKLQDEKDSIKTYNPASLVKGLARLSRISSYFQWTGTIILPLAVSTREVAAKYIDNYNYVSAIQKFSIFAFLLSFVLSSLYAYLRKRLAEVKELTEEEKAFLKYEYRGKFLWPCIFWAGCFAILRWLTG